MSFDRGQKRNMGKIVRSEGTVQGVSLLFVYKLWMTGLHGKYDMSLPSRSYKLRFLFCRQDMRL